MSKTLKLEDFKANTKEWFLEQLVNMSAPQALQTISDLYDELHKLTYPKTYDECCDILGIDVSRGIEHTEHLPFYRDINQYDTNILTQLKNLRKLIICRDAYWKTAGEQMGLDKPWEPDFSDDSLKYNILSYENKITLSDNNWGNRILAFPSIEIRNAFYDNFKYLIEQCKELL